MPRYVRILPWIGALVVFLGVVFLLSGCQPYRSVQEGFAKSMYPEYYQQYPPPGKRP
jgi:hypothetical protein